MSETAHAPAVGDPQAPWRREVPHCQQRCGIAARNVKSAIHLATVRDPHDENPDLLILDDIHDAEVTNPQPHRPGGLPGQGTYPGRAWIGRQAGDRPQDPAGSLLVQLAQLP